MNDLPALGKILIVFGLAMIIIGITLIFMHKIPYLGKLPGDIYVQRKSFSFYFPFVTCLVLSSILSLIFWLFSRK